MTQPFRDDSRLFLDFLREIKGSDESYRDEIWMRRDLDHGPVKKLKKGTWPYVRIVHVDEKTNIEPIRKKEAVR